MASWCLRSHQLLAVNGEMTFTASIAIRIDERQTTSKIMRGYGGEQRNSKGVTLGERLYNP